MERIEGHVEGRRRLVEKRDLVGEDGLERTGGRMGERVAARTSDPTDLLGIHASVPLL